LSGDSDLDKKVNALRRKESDDISTVGNDVKLKAMQNFNAMLKSEIWAKLSVSEKNRSINFVFKRFLNITIDKNSKAYNLIANYGVFENIETTNNPTDFVKKINILFKKNGSTFLNQ